MSSEHLRILIYGADTLGYEIPKTPQSTDKYLLEYCPVKTSKDLSEFNVVVFFEKLFEKYNDKGEIICSDKEEMLKRSKQIFKLFEKGGHVCSLYYDINDTYVMRGYFDARTYESNDTNLTKLLLNDYGIEQRCRKSTDTPLKHFKLYRNEYKKYSDDYGVCQTYFDIPFYKEIDIKKIFGLRNGFTGAIINERIFILPCHAPDKDENATKKLFSTLALALYENISKLSTEIPSWINEGIIFPEEKKVLDKMHHLSIEIDKVKIDLNFYKIFKGCLAFSGNALVESIATIFESFFKMHVIKNEQFIEDLMLCTAQEGKDKTIALVEIKGVNSGIKREHINQADSHRERLGLQSNSPTLLIVNTKMDATNFEEKELEVAHEQIKKAVTDNVLIIRTLDLINVIYLIENEVMTRDDFIKLIQSASGWMKTTKTAYEIIKD